MKQQEAEAEHAHRLHADEQRQWHAVQGFAQRFCARDDKADDHDGEHHRETKSGRADSMLVVQGPRRRQDDDENEPCAEPSRDANASRRVAAECAR